MRASGSVAHVQGVIPCVLCSIWLLKLSIKVRLERLYNPRWNTPVIRAPRGDLGACISCARDACVWRAHVSRQMHASKRWCKHAVVPPVGLLCNAESPKCMSCEWGLTDIIHEHRRLDM